MSALRSAQIIAFPARPVVDKPPADRPSVKSSLTEPPGGAPRANALIKLPVDSTPVDNARKPATVQRSAQTGAQTAAQSVAEWDAQGAARLARGLASLNAVLEQQCVAIAAWRDSLAALRNSTAGLGTSMARYHASLGALGADLTALNGQARALERWAGDTLARTPD